jgi:hypothetical protein
MNSTPTVLIAGGASDIGRAVALHYAEHGYEVILAARDMATCRRNADDVAVRTGRAPSLVPLDILQTDRFAAFVADLPRLPDTVICLIGLLGDQAQGQADPALASLTMRSNFEGPALFLEAFAAPFAMRGGGALIGVSSVAGDRGRSSNYIYGAAKAGFAAYLSGLRHRLARKGVCVITVKPGFVRTRMTAGLALPSLLTAGVDQVAKAIFVADQARRPRSLYVGLHWRAIMTLIRLLPEPLFLRTNL